MTLQVLFFKENHQIVCWFGRGFCRWTKYLLVLELNIVCKQNLKHKEIKVMNDTNNLAHTTWNCKYHIVFAPKYRRLVFYGQKRKEIGAILRQLCEWKNVEIVEAEVCPDHIHMLVKMPPKESVSGFIGFLKGKSSLLIYQKYANMKYKYRDRTFWCRGYYVDTVGKNTQKIRSI